MTITHVNTWEDKPVEETALTINEYQHEAAKTARADAPTLRDTERYAVIGALNHVIEGARLAERNKKRLFHGKEAKGNTTRYRSDQLPENTLDINWLLGLAGEVGELIESVLRGDSEDDIEAECADILWYLSQFLTARELSLEDAARNNLVKLAARHDGEFTEHKEVT